jgi:hypothetical protein
MPMAGTNDGSRGVHAWSTSTPRPATSRDSLTTSGSITGKSSRQTPNEYDRLLSEYHRVQESVLVDGQRVGELGVRAVLINDVIAQGVTHREALQAARCASAQRGGSPIAVVDTARRESFTPQGESTWAAIEAVLAPGARLDAADALALPYVRRHNDPVLSALAFGDATMLIDEAPSYSPWLYLLTD